MAIKKKLSNVLPIIIIIAVGLLIFWPTLSLEVFGDNWLVFYYGKINFDLNPAWGSWLTYFNPYSGSHLMLYLIQNLFGYSGTALYTFSLAARILLTVSFYYFLIKLKLSKAASLAGSLLLLVSPIGLEVVDWAFQMNSYLALSLILICMLNILSLKKPVNIYLIILTFLLATGINGVRVHGTAPLIWAMLLSKIVTSKKDKKRAITALLGTVIVFFLMYQAKSFGDPANTRSMLTPGFESIKTSLEDKDYLFVSNFFANIGNSLLPQESTNYFINLNLTQTILGRFRPGVEALIFTGLFIGFLLLAKAKTSSVKKVIFFGSLLTVSYLINKFLYGAIPDVQRLSIILGISFVLSMIYFAVEEIVNKNFEKLFLTLFILFVSTFYLVIPWVHGPESVFPSTHRYFIFAAVVIPLLSAKSLKKYLALPYLIIFFIAFATVTQRQVGQMQYRHSQDYAGEIWSQIDEHLKDKEFGKNTSSPSVFYLEGDEPDRLHSSIGFGFPFRMGLAYDINKQLNLPIATTNKQEFVSMITDGKASKRYIGEEYVFPEDHVYAYKITGNSVEPINIDKILE